jgi:hypothetical protein
MKTQNALPRKWLLMAVVDILLVSISTPLAFYVALLYDQGESAKFAWFMVLVIILNAISYSFGWLVSFRLFKNTER